MLLRQLFENTATPKTAVLGWGRGMGHKGHMLLAKAVLHHAQENQAKPFFVVSRTSLVDPSTGQPWADKPTFTKTKDDPLTPDEKLNTYRKVFPQNAEVFSVATADATKLEQVMAKIAREGFNKVILVVGEDQKDSMGYLTRPAKSTGVPPYKEAGIDQLEIISRQDTTEPSSMRGSPEYQEGPRATPMRQVLMDPSKSEQEQFAIWRRDMPDNLSDEEVMDLMLKAKQRMSMVPAGKRGVKERMLPPSTFAGYPKNKLGAAAHLKGKMKRPARAGDLVGDAQESIEEDSYKIAPGDNLSTLAKKFGTTVDALMKANPQIKDANRIQAGATLNVPGKGSEPKGSVRSGPNTNIKPDTRARAQAHVAPLDKPKAATLQKSNALQEPGFMEKLKQVADNLQINANDLLGVMKHESRMNPAAVNKQSGATGLIQFMPRTAQSLGTSTDELRTMSALDQLDYVERYFRPIAGKAKDIGDLYMFTFMPAAVGKPDDFVIGIKNGEKSLFGLNQGKLYAQNATFDKSGKGYYTVGDIKSRISGFAEGIEESWKSKLAGLGLAAAAAMTPGKSDARVNIDDPDSYRAPAPIAQQQKIDYTKPGPVSKDSTGQKLEYGIPVTPDGKFKAPSQDLPDDEYAQQLKAYKTWKADFMSRWPDAVWNSDGSAKSNHKPGLAPMAPGYKPGSGQGLAPVFPGAVKEGKIIPLSEDIAGIYKSLLDTILINEQK